MSQKTIAKDPPPIRRRTRAAGRVMIIDDSLTVRTVLGRTIEAQDDLTVAASASSAEQALAMLEDIRVDAILLDLEMPGMGGLAALPRLLEKAQGAPVLVVSALTDAGARHTLDALAMGATDTLMKPASGGFDPAYRTILAERIRNLCAVRSPVRPASPDLPARPACSTRPYARRPAHVVAIAGSTGAVHALCLVLRQLPPRIGVPITVTQHLPASFLPVFARQLALASGREAVIASDRVRLEPDVICIAPASGHLAFERTADSVVARIDTGAARSGCTPSADPMYASLAECFGDRVLAIVLSGMGTDGAEGARALATAGASIVAQDEDSSAVWGMPKAVARAGLASAILGPARMAEAIAARVDASSWT